MCWRSWVQIPAPYTGLIFSHIFVVKKLCLFEKSKMNYKEAGDGPFLKERSKLSGQSYKQFTLVIFDSGVVIWGIFKSGTTLES